MSRAECFRVLGLDHAASWEGIRQAYKDLVRVWHPDRFQSDPELQDRAEQQLQRINEAYFTLKNSRVFGERRPEPAPPPKPADPAPAVVVPPRPSGPDRFPRKIQFRRPIKAVWLGLVCLAPLAIGILLADALRVPALESLILQDGSSRPTILMPSRIVSPIGDVPTTADALSSWARGEAMDLWKSIPKIGERPSERLAAAAKGAAGQRDSAPVAPGTPENGTEMLRTRMSGGSELWVSNRTSQDAVAKLVEADTASPVRVVYIQAKNKVCIRHIAPGLYDLLAETGENWDPDRVRFQTRRHPLQRSGPFQCFDVTSMQGTWGPKYNIVLGTR
ncbi:MAG: J domain-containing protein [Bryobacteraceae bacterium]|jgi:hypothetical protein